MYQLNATILSNEEEISSQIAEAIERMNNGTYGICIECGEPIPIARLQALPYAAWCISCAQTNEQTKSVNLNNGRPRFPTDTLLSEGELNERHFPQGDKFEEEAELFEEGSRRGLERPSDEHAVGTAGGGDSLGGLAGSNLGHGDPQIADLEDAMGNGRFDPEQDDHRHRYRQPGE